MRTQPGPWLLALGLVAGCALKEPPMPERAAPRSPLVYAYQQPADVLDADWTRCDLEADQRAWVDYRISQQAAAAGFFGAIGTLGVPTTAALAVTAGTAGIVALDETALRRIPVVQRRRVREQLADLSDYYARRAHRCLIGQGYPTLPVPAPVPRHDYSRCSATTLDEC